MEIIANFSKLSIAKNTKHCETNFFCPEMCCKMISKKYIPPKKCWPRRDRSQRAGVFITDTEKKCVLLIQSCGNCWGPPKGAAEKGETIKQAAIRELKEETGISALPEDLIFLKNISRGTYFNYTIPKKDLKLPNRKGYNDATGIGWISFKCLEKYREYFSKILNYPAKILISMNLYFLGYVKMPIYKNNFREYKEPDWKKRLGRNRNIKISTKK